MTIFSEVVSKRSLFCTIASMLDYRNMLPLFLVSEGHLIATPIATTLPRKII